MADLQKIIEIVFQGTDKTGEAVLTVTKGLDAVANKAQDVTGPLADIADTIATTGLALAGLGTAFLGFAFKESVAFESAVLDLAKVLDESEGGIDSYIPRIDELSSTYGVAAENVVAAAAEFKQSGFTIEEALLLTDAALKAVKISELDANESSTLLQSTLRGFGEEAGEAARLLDILNAISNKYGVNVGELGKGLAELAPIAKAAGLGFEETAGLLTPVIELFGSGSESATALKTSLIRLGSDTSTVVDALNKLGVAQTSANGELRLSGDILADLAKVWPTLTDSQQLYYAGQLAGTNQAAKFQEALSKYERGLSATEVAFGAAGSAQEEWLRVQGSAEEVINRTAVSFDKLLRVVGDQYRTEMTGAIGATGGLADAFARLIQEGKLDELFQQLRPTLAEFEVTIAAIAKNLPQAFDGLDLGPITRGFEAIGDAATDLFDGIDLQTAEGLEKLFQDLTNIGGGFLQVVAGLVKGITPAVQALADLGQEFGDLSPDVQKNAGEFLGWAKAADVVLSRFDLLTGSLEAVGIGLQAIAGASILKTLTTMTDGFGSLATKLGAGAAAAGSVYFAFQQMSEAVDDYNARNVAYQRAVEAVSETEFERSKSLQTISDKLGITIPNMEEFNRLAEDGQIVFDEASGTWKTATEAVEQHGDAVLLTGEEVAKAVELERQFEAAIRQEKENIQQADSALVLRGQRFQEQTQYTAELVDGVITYTQKTTSKTAATKADTAATKDAVTESEKYRLALEKIASDERLANIEAKVSLETAELEAATAVTIASFESIDNTITSTGDLLGTLFEQFNEADSIRDKWTIEDQIKTENKLREEAAALQSALTREQIEYLRQKAASLARGDALIKISGDGLEPELEAFMWKIIDRVQVRASDEGAEFLLGLA